MLRVFFGIGLISLIATEMALLAVIASQLTIDYFDAFEYMANARVLAEFGEYASDLTYMWRRPPLVPVLQSWIYPSGGGLDAALLALSRSHMLAWALSFTALVALYRHLARVQSRELALLGTFLVAANPMFLHLVPFVLSDVPAMLFTLLALDGCLRAPTGSRLQGVFWSLSLTAAMLTKYNLLLLGPSLVLFVALSTQSGSSMFERLRSPRILFPLIGAGVLWYAVHLGMRLWLEGPSFGALIAIVGTLLGEVSMVSYVVWDDPLYEYLQELLQVTPIALLVCTFVGIGIALRRRSPADRLHLLWLVIFLLVMSLAVGSKSSRYLLPVLPSFVYLDVRV
jgi:4-amino-4-deoxy-L-arabinose transferase-like glycosyltransferase